MAVKQAQIKRPLIINSTETPIEEPIVEEVSPERIKAERERDIEYGERAVSKALDKESKSELIRYYVPRDITSGAGDVFERSINGHIIRLKAGQFMNLPKYVVDYIEERIRAQQTSEQLYSKYKGDGIQL